MALATTISAQTMHASSISIAANKSTIRSGEQVVLTAQGYNDELLSLQWQVSTDGNTWKNIAKATGNIFETAALTTTNFFRVVAHPNRGYIVNEEISNIQVISMSEETSTFVRAKK